MLNVLHRIRTRLAYLLGSENPRQGEEKGPEYYDATYLKEDPCEDLRGPYWHSYYYFLWAVIADRLRRAGSRSVLEVGCGPGRLAEFLLDFSSLNYVGFDFSRVAVEMATDRLPEVTFHVADARTTTLYNSVDHDAVVCTEVLEHVKDDLRIISQFGEGKRCLASVPSFPHESHVRCFPDAAAVTRRYGPYFQELDVVAFRHPLAPQNGDARFFLCEGIRNGATYVEIGDPDEGPPL